ncbi:MAG: hypothetical protein H0U66_08700 [Gemmatimonadaceae bacterium]|nr:hypothetical protein [Gemmatimonadaceae bacterium]
MSRFARVGCGVLMGAVLCLSSRLSAQQKAPPPKKGQAIEIRGQVPTPQVVTVRPREVPAYDRQLLSPAFYDGTGSTASAGGVQLVPESQVRETTVLDTLVKSAASSVATISFPPVVGNDSVRNASAPAAQAGTSTAELEAMRHELAVRRSRLDSLQREAAIRQQASVPLQSPPALRRSAADSAARAEEIESIRRELEYRRARLDSLQREVDRMGKAGRPAPPRKKTTTDSTTAAPKTPRGRR